MPAAFEGGERQAGTEGCARPRSRVGLERNQPRSGLVALPSHAILLRVGFPAHHSQTQKKKKKKRPAQPREARAGVFEFRGRENHPPAAFNRRGRTFLDGACNRRRALGANGRSLFSCRRGGPSRPCALLELDLQQPGKSFITTASMEVGRAGRAARVSSARRLIWPQV